MKALTIKEPWASLIDAGKKTVEVRSWKRNLDGEPILLAASKNPEGPLAGKCFGAAVFKIRPMTRKDVPASCLPADFDPTGFWAWEIVEYIRNDNPFPVRGWPGIFEINSNPVTAP